MKSLFVFIFYQPKHTCGYIHQSTPLPQLSSYCSSSAYFLQWFAYIMTIFYICIHVPFSAHEHRVIHETDIICNMKIGHQTRLEQRVTLTAITIFTLILYTFLLPGKHCKQHPSYSIAIIKDIPLTQPSKPSRRNDNEWPVEK